MFISFIDVGKRLIFLSFFDMCQKSEAKVDETGSQMEGLGRHVLIFYMTRLASNYFVVFRKFTFVFRV